MAIGNTIKESMRDYVVYLLVSIGMAIITFSFAHNFQETRESRQWLNMAIELIFVLMAALASFVSMVKFVFAWSSDVFDEMDRNQNSYGLLPRTNPDASTNNRLPTSNASGRGDSSATTVKSSKGKKGEPQPSTSGLQTAATTAAASKAKKAEPVPSTSGLQGTSSKSASASKAKKVESGSSASGLQAASSTAASASKAKKAESGSSTSGLLGASSTSAPASTARKAESGSSTSGLQGASSTSAPASTARKAESLPSTFDLQTASSSSASEKQPDALTRALEIAASLEFETCENQPMLPSTGLTGFLQEASEIQAAATEECVIVMPTDLESALAAEVQSISSGSSTEDFEVVHPHILQATATARELQESVKTESSDLSID